jgi:hypothetical protein
VNKNCRYLIKYKDYNSLDFSGSIYKCALANVLLTLTDLKQKWACGGCIVPQNMNNKPCKYLIPHKYFPIRGSSHTWFSCEQLNIIMDLPAEFCHFNCAIYEQLNNAKNNHDHP